MNARPVEARYAAIVQALCAEPDVASGAGKGFGSGGLMVHGKLFATLRKDELLLKLPAGRVSGLIAAEGWLALAREAQAFVGDGA